MAIQKYYVTPDDFKNYWGIDLRNALRDDDNVSNQADRFLERVQDRLENWINNNTFRRLKFEQLNPFQMENFKKAILTQAMYMYKQGDMGLDSGYDSEKGVIVDRGTLVQLQVCQAAIDYLSNAGLFNLSMKNRPRYIYGYPGMAFADNFDGGGGPAIVPPPPTPSPSPAPGGNVLSGIGYTEDN